LNLRFLIEISGAAKQLSALSYQLSALSSQLSALPIVAPPFGVADARRGGGPDGPVTVIRLLAARLRGIGVIGKSLTSERVSFTIIGVTPPGFFGTEVGRVFDVVIPLGTEPLIRGKESVLDRESKKEKAG